MKRKSGFEATAPIIAVGLVALSLYSIFSEFLGFVEGFFNAILGSVDSAITQVIDTITTDAANVIQAWTAQVGAFGIWIPVVLVATVLITAGVVYVILGFGDFIDDAEEL